MSHNYCRRERDGSGGGGRRPTPNGDLEALQVCPGETAGRGQPAAPDSDRVCVCLLCVSVSAVVVVVAAAVVVVDAAVFIVVIYYAAVVAVC